MPKSKNRNKSSGKKKHPANNPNNSQIKVGYRIGALVLVAALIISILAMYAL